MHGVSVSVFPMLRWLEICSSFLMLLTLVVAGTKPNVSDVDSISRIVTVGNAGGVEKTGNYYHYPQPQTHHHYSGGAGGAEPTFVHPPHPSYESGEIYPSHDFTISSTSHHHLDDHPPDHHISHDHSPDHHISHGYSKFGSSAAKVLTTVVKAIAAVLGSQLVLKIPLLLLKLLLVPLAGLVAFKPFLLTSVTPLLLNSLTTTTTTTTTQATTTTTALSRRRGGKIDIEKPNASPCMLSVACQIGAAWGSKGASIVKVDAEMFSFPEEFRNAYDKGANKGNCEENVAQCRKAIDSGQDVESL